jgi:hypothetical protein
MRPDYLSAARPTGCARLPAGAWPRLGCSANAIAAISGHSTLTEVARYTKAAEQELLARQGMAAIARTKTDNGG